MWHPNLLAGGLAHYHGAGADAEISANSDGDYKTQADTVVEETPTIWIDDVGTPCFVVLAVKVCSVLTMVRSVI